MLLDAFEGILTCIVEGGKAASFGEGLSSWKVGRLEFLEPWEKFRGMSVWRGEEQPVEGSCLPLCREGAAALGTGTSSSEAFRHWAFGLTRDALLKVEVVGERKEELLYQKRSERRQWKYH